MIVMSGRGRGRRAKTTLVHEQNVQEGPHSDETNPVKKTSKKKQFPVVAIITPDGIEGNLLSEVKRPLIVHLPIQSKDVLVTDMPVNYDPHPPGEAIPYDSNADNPFYEDTEQLLSADTFKQQESVPAKTELVQVSKNESALNTSMDYYGLKSTLLIQYKDSADVRTIPEKSDIACFWCSHIFAGRPVVLPLRDTGEYLVVTGNFCCPECASAYLFDIRQDSHTRWEQLALLYRVYGDACNGKIQPAPSRQILKIFGGTLSIQEYRSLIRSQTVRVDIHLPPMVSILATMDTKPIDFYDSSLTKGITETVKERLQKAEEVLRLKRTKPLKAWESTLDACLNLKIKN